MSVQRDTVVIIILLKILKSISDMVKDKVIDLFQSKKNDFFFLKNHQVLSIYHANNKK